MTRGRLLAVIGAAVSLLTGTQAAPASAAAPAWQPVAVTGPTHMPPQQSETQEVGVDADGGSFTLTARHAVARGSGDISLSTNVIANVVTSGGAFAVGQRIEGAGLRPDTTITAVGSDTLTLSKAPAEVATGVVLLATDATTGTTPQLDFDASAAEVESALNALPLINAGGGSVSVAGGPGGPDAATPYLVSFDGALADADQPALSVDSSLLTGSGRSATVVTTVPGGPGTTALAVYAQNVGGLTSSGTITATVTLPPGVTTTATPIGNERIEVAWICLPPAGQTFTCTSNRAVPAGAVAVPIKASLITETTTAGEGTIEVSVTGGGATGTADYSMPLKISPTPAEPGFQAFTAAAYDENGELDTRAGGHPYSGSAAVFANTYRNRFGAVVPVGEFKDIEVDLPPGFLGNPIATPQCPQSNLADYSVELEFCPPDAIVGHAAPVLAEFGASVSSPEIDRPVHNIEAPLGYPGMFYFNVKDVPIYALGTVRSDGDYGLTVGSLNTFQYATVFGSFFTFWGNPADPAHDIQRCNANGGGVNNCPIASTAPETAFLSSPTDCAREAVEPPVARLRVTTWQEPTVTHTGEVQIPPVTGCDKLKFDADFTFEPDHAKSDSPASFRTELAIPSEGLTDPDKLMTPTIRESVVDLPKGVALNPSAADGLAACSKQQIGLKGTDFPMPNRIRFTKDPNTCPDASKIGSGALKSELLEDPLQGELFLAAQGEGNPFGSLFAIYLVIEDPRHGIFIKLPAEVQVNKQDGQQKVVFRDLPQLPFTWLRLNLKGGNRSPLASPTTCGNYVTDAINTPWSHPESGPPTTSSNGFEINQGPNGQPCAPTPADRPFNLDLNAGTDSPAAGAHSPLTFQITRPDGAQEIDTLELSPPPGLVASLKGIPTCSEEAIRAAASSTGKQEQANPACSSASQIGRTLVGAGAGPTPYYTPGKLYLAGPYKGAPVSVVAITPSVAGPFDLGNVVVRTAVFVDRSSARVTAKADPIPQILEGVPLRIRDIRVILDRPGFSLNPTNCDAGAIDVKVSGNSGATANLSDRFQVAGCENLGFKPRFSAKVTGGTKRGDHPAFSATVTWPQGAYANTKNVAVTLPRSEFLDQANIRTICTRVQAAADQCPPGSIYGEAEAITPLLDEPLKGPVYLKSSDNKLPDLAIKLRGPASRPVEVEFQGRIDSIKGQIRNTIEGLPDVPVSKFVLKMKGGRKSLLVNSRNLCTTKKVRMDVKVLGQNNKRADQKPVLRNSCKKRKAKKGTNRSKRRRGR